MTLRPRTTALASILLGALLLGGCNGAFVGNIVVLFVSVGIFFGTLNLGRLTRTGSATESSQRDN